ILCIVFFFSSRRRHTSSKRDWSSDVCSSDLDVEITCLPQNIPEALELDIAELDLGEMLHLSDIPLPEGVQISVLMYGDEDADQAVVSVNEPQAEEPEEDRSEEHTSELQSRFDLVCRLLLEKKKRKKKQKIYRHKEDNTE